MRVISQLRSHRHRHWRSCADTCTRRAHTNTCKHLHTPTHHQASHARHNLLRAGSRRIISRWIWEVDEVLRCTCTSTRSVGLRISGAISGQWQSHHTRAAAWRAGKKSTHTRTRAAGGRSVDGRRGGVHTASAQGRASVPSALTRTRRRRCDRD
jgi:hypothetical protein